MRDHTKLTAPSGKELLIHSYLTAREILDLKLCIQKHVKVGSGPDGDMQKVGLQSIDHVAAEKEEQEMFIRYGVASYDGSTENIFERLIDGPNPEDYDFALEQTKALRKNPTAPKS